MVFKKPIDGNDSINWSQLLFILLIDSACGLQIRKQTKKKTKTKQKLSDYFVTIVICWLEPELRFQSTNFHLVIINYSVVIAINEIDFNLIVFRFNNSNGDDNTISYQMMIMRQLLVQFVKFSKCSFAGKRNACNTKKLDEALTSVSKCSSGKIQ